MGKNLFIAEKPSVAREFAAALKINMNSREGYLEGGEAIVTWCVGHLVTMSYPEAYDEKYRRWSFDTIPFIPETFRYEVIESARKQYSIVSGLLNRPDVSTIYVCTDSGREGEYIYRLVEQMAQVQGKERKRVWIDSQTEEEILRGIREAKDLKEYDNLSHAAYLRAKEDYLMGINFSRALTLKYGRTLRDYLKRDKAVISVGRVMTCVLGMIVNREREIRSFVKTPFYRVIGNFKLQEKCFSGEWKAVEGSGLYASPLLYKENGFREKESAEKLIAYLEKEPVGDITVESIERKQEKKNPPLLYNLAELQNDCSKYFKISPDETLRIVQELYERKMVTYPRTDARVLSSAVAKEIHKNIGGLRGFGHTAEAAAWILSEGRHKGIAKTRYVNDKQITDHYAIIPTGQGLNNLSSLPPVSAKVYEIIARRFLSIFYPPAVYRKFALVIRVKEERFFANFKVLEEEGYLKLLAYSFKTQEKEEGEEKCDSELVGLLSGLKKGHKLQAENYEIKEGETSPPKRYTSGSIILTMENAGQFIEDEELRAQIKGSGIGTSATRAEILKKLVNIEYLALNKKSQVLTPTLMGEMVYDVVNSSIRPLLDPALTASWEKGLTLVADGKISPEEYMKKLSDFVTRRTNIVKQMNNQRMLYAQFQAAEANYSSKQ
ncbi:MAG TPA: type IA DNA topoisomerase [Candidatus Acetatifactor stercoripullorum]|uniref:DNA topoisomerase n=1 Tax=Candidatus Acetatifactor stercoripullorum TaxID=2838414 RepID=A0A9D1R7H0_9FIRM|nr:DNA topoisomerase [uncultured Acetatifactor sp.]HIW82360.1 type IA DNA topoisomerase [Candidatus Acetatifactor stercoripullorum]